MAGILDRCIWIAAGAGTGSFVQSAAQTGFQTMQSAGAVDAQTYPYAAQSADLSQWEYGLGTWTAASSTLARTTIYSNSLGGTSAINFNTAPQVMVTLTAVTARAMLHGVMGGRLTLTSATPVLTANALAQTTVYYTPYLHNNVTCFDGVSLSNIDFVETSVALDTTNWLSGKLYDFFIFLNGSTPTLGYGPAWTNTTTRSAATALTRVQGQWVNNTTITLRTNSTTTFSVATNQAVYVGTGYATANGQTAMAFQTAGDPATTAYLGLFNAYNRVPMDVYNQDNATSWTYNATAFRLTNTTGVPIAFVDGLGEVFTHAKYFVSDGGTGQRGVAIGFNWSSGAGAVQAFTYTGSTTLNLIDNVTCVNNPAMGLNTIVALESGNASTAPTFYGTSFGSPATQTQQLSVRLRI